MNRRTFLRGGMQSLLALGIARALHNTVVGYGQFGVGDNLRTQDLDKIAATNLPTLRGAEAPVAGTAIRVFESRIRYDQDGQWRGLNSDAPDEVHRLEPIITELQDHNVTFRFSTVDDFFTFLENEETEPVIVDLLRRQPGTEPGLLNRFDGVDPSQTPQLVNNLATVFREHSRYDIPRYLAGSIDDNVLPIDGNLREPFEPAVSFETFLETEQPIGLFCTEYVALAKRAFHAVPPVDQSHPIYSFRVRNARHKHVYNGIGSVITRGQSVILPMTFVDYTDSTLADDFRLRRVIGEQIDAYDETHRADEFRW